METVITNMTLSHRSKYGGLSSPLKKNVLKTLPNIEIATKIHLKFKYIAQK